jgi:hypothetical protein
MRMRVGHIAAIGAAAALAACGRLDTPELSTGAVSGQLFNAASPALGYAYVLGAPDRRASLAADGRFTIERAPVGAQQVVLFDGGSRAELLAVVVRPGSRTDLDRDAEDMPLAGRISAAVRPASGALGTGARFTVLGTVHQELAAVGEGLVIGPLPTGTFTLSAALTGFRPVPVPVAVAAGVAVGAEVTMDVDATGGAQMGCLATSCPNGLHCEPADGRCYACVVDADCGSGNRCDAPSHTCVEGVAGAGAFCASAADASFCAGGVLVPVSGGLGYCSASCAAPSDCPAGWECINLGAPAGLVCVVKQTCLDVVATYGSACAHDDPCQLGLFGGKCLRVDDEQPGYCSAPCASDAACAASGYGACKAWYGSGSYCQP